MDAQIRVNDNIVVKCEIKSRPSIKLIDEPSYGGPIIANYAWNEIEIKIKVNENTIY